MADAKPDRQTEAHLAEGRRTRAATTAWVTGAFAALIIALLATNAYQLRAADPLNATRLSNLRTLLRDKPEDESLKTRIRVVDHELRQEYFQRRRISRIGGYLLLASLVAFLSCLKAALPPPPRPKPRRRRKHQPEEEEQMPATPDRTRLALLAMGALLLVGGVGVFLPGRPAFLQQVAGAEEKKPTAALATDEELAKQWPQFRGPFGLGVVGGDLPTSWDSETGDGILWKVVVPLPGNNSAVVWGNNVFLTGATPEERALFCFDAETGDFRWRADVKTDAPAPPEDFEPTEDAGYAASTCATDGRRVYAMFVNGDLAGVDFDGKVLWARSLGLPDNAYGHASSLATYGGLVLVQFDQAGADDGKSALLALDGATGRTKWKRPRPVGNSWSSPVIASAGEAKQLITAADPWVIAYDPVSGDELWKSECLSGELASSVAAGADLVFAVEPYSRVVALKMDGTGNVTETHLAWEVDEGVPEFISPVSNGELLFCLPEDGWLVCYEVVKGEKLWEKELDMLVHASPIIVGDKLLVSGNEGEFVILEAGKAYKELGRGRLGPEEVINATPAAVGGKLYIRGKEHLYCVGKK